jgi:rare lipoprotein A
MTNKPAGKRVLAQASRLFGVCLVTAVLAACAQSPGSPRASLSGHSSSLASAGAPKKHLALAAPVELPEIGTSSVGLASYYSEGTETASGERFNPQELTAAHPNLPFGTHLRVTNLATGQSVVVRVNDRGPFVPGRSVDVSYSAAQQLGFLESGTAKVKMEVVQ